MLNLQDDDVNLMTIEAFLHVFIKAILSIYSNFTARHMFGVYSRIQSLPYIDNGYGCHGCMDGSLW